jgi:hypothetical protein
VTAWLTARGELPVASLPSPGDGARVVAEPAVDVSRRLDSSAWAAVPRLTSSAAAGDHVGLGGVALAAAAALVASGGAKSVLVVGEAPDRAYAFLLEPCLGPAP